MKTKINVSQDKICKDIFVTLDDVSFSVDNFFGISSVHFFLSPEAAETLHRFLSSTLEDMERQKEDKDNKASEELRELVEENVSKHHEEPVRTEE